MINLRSRIAGFVVIVGVYTVTICVTSEGRWALWNLPSLLFVVGMVGGGLWASFGLRPTLKALRHAMTGESPTDPEDVAMQVSVCRRGYQLAWGSGIIGTIAGSIMILGSLDDMRQIGAWAAVCLLTLLYGAILAEFGFRVLQSCAADHDGLSPPDTTLNSTSSV